MTVKRNPRILPRKLPQPPQRQPETRILKISELRRNLPHLRTNITHIPLHHTTLIPAHLRPLPIVTKRTIIRSPATRYEITHPAFGKITPVRPYHPPIQPYPQILRKTRLTIPQNHIATAKISREKTRVRTTINHPRPHPTNNPTITTHQTLITRHHTKTNNIRTPLTHHTQTIPMTNNTTLTTTHPNNRTQIHHTQRL